MNQQALTDIYREVDRKCASFYYMLTSKKEFEPKWFVPTKENLDTAWETYKELKSEITSLESPDPVYTLLKHHFFDFMESVEYLLKDLEQNPLRDFFEFHEYFLSTVRTDNRHNLVRQTVIQNRLQQFRKNAHLLLKRTQEIQSHQEQHDLALSLRQEQHALYLEISKLIEYFPEFKTDQIRALADDFFAFHRLLDFIIQELSSSEMKEETIFHDNLNRTIKMDETRYRTLLQSKHGVNLDELLAWGKEEIKKTRDEVFAIAAKLTIPESPQKMKDITDILFKYEGPCESAEEMFARASAYLKRTKALAHEYVNLPEDENCTCEHIPYYYKDSYPWGGYEGGDFRKPPYHGKMFLNQHNYQNISDGWIKLNALHEAYPGHHVQFVRSAIDTIPETVKIGAKLTPLLEGTCIRTERAFETLFEEDPFFPLFVAYRRHHGSVRILVDLMLYYYGCPLEDAIKLYEEELGFDRSTARAQVQAHQNSPGYFTCYYYGLKKIEQWDKQLGLSKKDFTELLFSAGYISMESMEMLINLTPDDRTRYFTEFKSMYMN